MNVLEKNDNLLKTKLVLKATDKFSDAQAEKMFKDTEIRSEKDIDVLVGYLKKYRPNIFAKLNS